MDQEARQQGVSVSWGVLMADWPMVVLDIQAVFGAVWHRCLGEPWPWWRAMVLSIVERPETITYKRHILPRLQK